MRIYVAACACALALVSFGSSAEACTVPAKGVDPCAVFAPTGHQFHGQLEQKLTKQVTLRHPSFDKLNRKWYSYAIFTDGQLGQLVQSLRKTGGWSQEVELPEGQSSHTRYWGKNWQFAVFDPCVVEGYNVLRIAVPKGNGDVLDSDEDWQIVRGSDGKPLLFKL